ncbi:uncharacterized protein [Battus philenor]|uniref:uncharacterized protein n=1 Tax=Battus philenor TaxID=42288 RepID=UPI0035CEA8A5
MVHASVGMTKVRRTACANRKVVKKREQNLRITLLRKRGMKAFSAYLFKSEEERLDALLVSMGTTLQSARELLENYDVVPREAIQALREQNEGLYIELNDFQTVFGHSSET